MMCRTAALAIITLFLAVAGLEEDQLAWEAAPAAELILAPPTAVPGVAGSVARVDATTGAQAAHTSQIPSGRGVWLRGIVPAISFIALIKALCVASNLLQQMSLCPTALRMKRLKSTESVDSLPMVALCLMGIQWMCYGIFAWLATGDHKFFILVYANLGAAVLGAYCTYTFQVHCDNVKSWQKMKLYYACGVFIALAQVGVFVMRPLATSLFVAGSISSCMSIILSASPLPGLSHVFQTRSLDSMPVEMVFVNLVGNTVWLICGICIWDRFLIFCNVTQITIGCILVAVIVQIHPATQRFLPDSWAFATDGAAKAGHKASQAHLSNIGERRALITGGKSASGYDEALV